MRLFRRRMSASDKQDVLRVIRHIQTMYAYQQLTMERYNDALSRAGFAPVVTEFTHSATSGRGTAKSICDFVIPALVAKRKTFEQLHEEHVTFGRPTTAKLQSAYDDFGRLLATMRERTEAQYNGWLAWVGDAASTRVDTSALDLAERQALHVSIKSVNALIEAARIVPERFLDINTEAFNTVRASIGLRPLTGVEFRSRYFGGLEKGTGRFFNE